ncbi:MAG: DUF4332 domain-containing protein [Pirellulaceae bacterium]
MKISNLALNSSQRLTNLNHGLNVVFHRDSETIRSFHRTTNQVFFGEPTANGTAAELDIVERGETIRLRRAADGNELVATLSNGIAVNDVTEIERRIGESSARHVYHTEFGSRTAFDQLVLQARQCVSPPADKFSLQSLLAELELRDNLPETERFQKLQQRRNLLLNDIRALKQRLDSVELENHDGVKRVRRNIAIAEQRLADLGARRHEFATDWRRSIGRSRELTARLETIELQIGRVRIVLQNIDERIKAGHANTETTAKANNSGQQSNDLERRLRSVTIRLGDAVDQLTFYANDRNCVCKEQAEKVVERFATVARVVDDMGGNASTPIEDDSGRASQERRLESCRSQLTDYLQQLVTQRNNFTDRLTAMAATEDGETDRLTARLHNNERELTDTDREIEHEQRFANLHDDDILTRLRNLLPEANMPPLLKDLNRLVRELTAGEFVSIDMPPNRRDLVVINQNNDSFSSDILSRSTRDLLQTAVALAVANQHARNGTVRTVVLCDALQHIPASRLRPCIDILSDFTRHGHQVLLLTTQSNLLSVAKSLGICCFDCERRVSYPMESGGQSVKEVAWDCEEFPGELRDRTRTGWTSEVTRQPLVPRHNGPRQTPVVGWGNHILNGNGSADTSPSLARPMATESIPFGDHDLPIESLRVTGYFLELSDRITEMPFVVRGVSAAMTDHGVWTVANFLHADPTLLASRLHNLGVADAEVRQWQAQARLMCAIQKLRCYDARILVGCGITTAGQFEGLHPKDVLRLVEVFVATPDGSQIVRSGTTIETERIARWIRSLQRKNTNREQTTRHTFDERQSPDSIPLVASPPRDLPDQQSETRSKPRKRRPVLGPQATLRQKSGRGQNERSRLLPMKFHLEPNSHVEAAPTIGPRMAERLEAIEIITVADLLNAEPTDVAEKLEHRGTSAEVVCQWQRQAELVCRIPKLRGHDSQILVACDITMPEEIADCDPQDLLAIVGPFCSTKEGKRLLRNNKHPDLDEVEEWVEWAKQARQLAAA